MRITYAKLVGYAGLYTGLGIGKSLSGSAPVKFLWNVGLRLRVFAN